jgi:hypothetical protein
MGAAPAWAASSAAHPYSRQALAGQAALARMGSQGRLAAKFAAQTAPRVAVGFRGISRSSASGSVIGGVTKALSGSGGGGMGFPMPLLLIAMLAGAIVFGAWRLRSGEGEG